MVPGLRRTPLAEVDSAWLRMDEPANLMVVTGLMILETPVSFEDLRTLVVERLLGFPRFRQRVVDDVVVGTAQWEEDERLSLDYHVVCATFPESGTETALQHFVSELMSQPLDPKRPLWQIHVIPHYQGGSAIVTRIHHCIGDGLALIYVMLSMADGGPSAHPDAAAGPAGSPDLLETVTRVIGDVFHAAAHMPADVLREINLQLQDPDRLSQQVETVTTGAGALGKLLLMPPDPPTRFKGPLAPEKRVAWSRAVPVEALKRIGRATGATINDVMISCLAGALRRYLVDDGTALPSDMDIRGVVPVNLRPLDEAYTLGNQFGLVFLALPLGIVDPLDRLFEVRKRMNALKRSPEAHLTLQILRLLGLAPRPVFDLVVDLFGTKATSVVTNVIGPRTPIAFAGRTMRQAMFWVPCAGRLGLGVSLLSYAGQVWLGVQSDAGLVPDPGRVLDGFYADVEQLQELERVTHC